MSLAKRWKELAGLLAPEAGKPVLKLPGPDQGGIFGNSLTHFELMAPPRRETPFSIEGRGWSNDRCCPAKMTCPFGPLVIRKRLAAFDFDITEVKGILASESSDRHFPDVDAFGRDFTQYLGTPVDKTGLASMLAHNEIRILRKDGGDYVQLPLWDGRLFLMNDGGSHHFAGAAFIARSIDVPVPLSSALEVYALNAEAVQWLTSSSAIFLVREESCTDFILTVSALLGHCYQWQVPAGVCPDAVLILAPTQRRLSERVITVFTQAGVPDLSRWFEGLLVRQAHNRDLALQRLGPLPVSWF